MRANWFALTRHPIAGYGARCQSSSRRDRNTEHSQIAFTPPGPIKRPRGLSFKSCMDDGSTKRIIDLCPVPTTFEKVVPVHSRCGSGSVISSGPGKGCCVRLYEKV